jgi:hypothetical protein
MGSCATFALVAQLPVRSRQCAADTGVYVVDFEGVGHAFGKRTGAFGLPMLQAESAEIGTLEQSPQDGRRIVPAEILSAAGGSRCSARHPLTSCVDHRKLVPSRHRRCRMTASLRASGPTPSWGGRCSNPGENSGPGSDIRWRPRRAAHLRPAPGSKVRAGR